MTIQRLSSKRLARRLTRILTSLSCSGFRPTTYQRGQRPSLKQPPCLTKWGFPPSLTWSDHLMYLRQHSYTRTHNRAHRAQALPLEQALQDSTPTRSRCTYPALRPSDPSLHHGRDLADSFTASGLTNVWDRPLHTCSDSARLPRNEDENNKFYTNIIIFESCSYFKIY